jgi:hypothetical protein
MTTISTLDGHARRTKFTYQGSVGMGVSLTLKGKPYISSSFFDAILKQFLGGTIRGGFSMTNPSPGGLGEWVQLNSAALNGRTLTSRHASFIAAILAHEKRITSDVRGNAVYLHFP